MNKFHYCSDLHLEFGMVHPTFVGMTGDNLILAGDITVLRCLNPSLTDKNNKKTRDRTLKFFEFVQENFKKVYYLTGNHESYGFRIDLEKEYIEKYLPGIIHVNNSVHEIDENTVLMGGTLWTNMNNRNAHTLASVGNGMNDFRIIYKGKDDIWTPEDAADAFDTTFKFLDDSLEKYKDKNVIVATHHSPTGKGVNPIHSGNSIDHGYYSNLEQYIIDHPQIKYWVFGHTHIRTELEFGSTKVVSNARGYDGYEESAKAFSRDPERFFEV